MSENGDALLIDSAKLDDLNCQLSLKDREVSQLLADLQQAKQERDAGVQVVQKVLDEVQLQNSDLSRKVQSLTVKLESQADYASVKKDLAILKVTILP